MEVLGLPWEYTASDVRHLMQAAVEAEMPDADNCIQTVEVAYRDDGKSEVGAGLVYSIGCLETRRVHGLKMVVVGVPTNGFGRSHRRMVISISKLRVCRLLWLVQLLAKNLHPGINLVRWSLRCSVLLQCCKPAGCLIRCASGVLPCWTGACQRAVQKP